MMYTAPRTSTMLHGTATGRMENGSTDMLPMTSHISTKPMVQAMAAVSRSPPFRARKWMAMASTSAQMPHTAPFTGSLGKVSPKPV